MNIKTDKLVSWALVNTNTSDIEVLEFTREDVREAKRKLEKKGIETKIVQFKFNKFAR